MLLATGSVPRSLPGLEIDNTRVITSDDALGMDTIPGSVVILGAGAIGCEFASIFNSFGTADVTIIELLPRIVPNEDAAVSEVLDKSFRKKKIRVLTGTKVTAATNTGDSVDVTAQLADGTTETISAEYLLVATGRGPVTDGLGAEER